MNGNVSEWLGAVDGLPAVHERLRRVAIVGPMPALEMIRKEDGPRALFYCDPPYLHETRATTGEYGPHEMSVKDHRDLLRTLGDVEGRFLLSGYRSELYDGASERFGWNRHEFDLPNNASGGKAKRRMTECVWTNF
jgi:DNA adenine methylase